MFVPLFGGPVMSQFQYCLNGSTIRTTPVLRQIEAAGRAGYRAIELWHDKIDEHLDRGGSLAEIRAALDRWHLAVPTTIYMAGWFDASAEGYPGVLAECRRKLEQAAALGAVYAIASPPMGRADYALGAKRYRELLELGLSLGVRPSMEFLGFVEDLNTIEKAIEVLDRAGHPSGTTILDPFHISRGGGDMSSIGKLRADQIAICHFNDIPANPPPRTQRDEDRVLPGEGIYDLRQMLDLLAATGYSGWLSLELFREELWNRDPFEVAALGLEKMRSVAERR
jgi:sugar phosphate isomerase/epimerase